MGVCAKKSHVRRAHERLRCARGALDFLITFFDHCAVVLESAFFIGGAPQLKNKSSLYNSAKVRVGSGDGLSVVSQTKVYCACKLTLEREKKLCFRNELQDERIRISSVPVGTIHLELDVILRHFGAHDISWE